MYTLSQSMPKTSINKVKPHDSRINDHHKWELSSASSGHCNQTTNVHTKQLGKPRFKWVALIDQGANGSIAERDMRVIKKTSKTAEVLL